MHSSTRTISGFTLIEMSIVLMIIGLIVGGILTGQDLINAAFVRAQMSQIEKYQTAVRTFQVKYGYMPGDVPDPYASNFGFQPRGQYGGEGDGNGVLEGNCSNAANANSGAQAGCGELAVFWQDLSKANLIDLSVGTGVNYPNISAPAAWPNTTTTSTPAIMNWIPAAKIGQNTYVYTYSFAANNFFGLSTVTKIGWDIDSTVNTPGLTVQQAYNIDKKIDDGLPQSGSVTACYANSQVTGGHTIVYAKAGRVLGANNGTQWSNGTGSDCTPTTTATGYSNANCFDNNGVAGSQTYSLNQNAPIQNCALSFQLQ